ncbi:MAG: phenylalanine--tRNA ligase subunit beta [Candidatus Pacebacteria bacterium]|nr:phenylalanine--tRNA ligase subunit beta [Candidatus Paceibacterota bacterium]MCD8508050.1 phenylalanine--tRNA ligase subunit beta [Candidatus Paceibacterota bacterium]MCD8528290.1 phenylalanine--tRNA ligase subunit beta [Candidatus Paceibacterota bacterium]MCD8563979.1 phenylalanine--tRNA ligase subunit beta [Candidatus Paceibacterota bacterium]
MKLSHTWLQKYFTEPLPPLAEIEAALVVHSFETEGMSIYGDDAVIEIDVLPNRAHDVLSHAGAAREIAALLERSDYRAPLYTTPQVDDTLVPPLVHIHDTEACSRYHVRLIHNINVQESPLWLVQLLGAVGQKSINALVDATNYIMLDRGTPVHVFDADKVVGDIHVRYARDGETCTLLGSGEQERTLNASMLVIADEEKILALAGIKGGTAAEVTSSTKNILVEIAHFDPMITRRTRNATGLVTDSAKRFENTFHNRMCDEVVDVLAALIAEAEIAGTDTLRMSPAVSYGEAEADPQAVSVTYNHIQSLLGVAITHAEIHDILERLSMTYTVSDDTLLVTPPYYRKDIHIPEDIIEEIGRMYGYHRIPSQPLPHNLYTPEVHQETALMHRMRSFLVDRGWSEIMTYTFRKKGDITMLNPVAKDKPALRTNLSEGMQESLDKNMYYADLFAADTIRLFEIGKVFTVQGEKRSLAIGLGYTDKKARKIHGPEHEVLTQLLQDMYNACGIHEVYIPQSEHHIHEIDISKLALSMDKVSTYGNTSALLRHTRFTSLSPYPHSTRDVAVWVPAHVSQETVHAIIRQHAGPYCFRMDLFDVFSKEDRISLAFRIVFQAPDKTLTDTELDQSMSAVYNALTQEGYEIR